MVGEEGRVEVGESADGFDGFLESAPNINIFGRLADDLETFIDVDDVVDAPAFDPELESDDVEFEQDLPPFLEVLDEFSAQLLQTLLLAVVRQDLLFEPLLLLLQLRPPPRLTPLFHHEHRLSACQQFPDHLLMIVAGLRVGWWLGGDGEWGREGR